MNNQDDQLRRLLQQWREIEPTANFEAQVWRRIRQPVPSWADWLRAWVPRPAWAWPVAIAAGVVIGIGSGMFSTPASPATEQLSFLAPNTLAGSLGR